MSLICSKGDGCFKDLPSCMGKQVLQKVMEKACEQGVFTMLQTQEELQLFTQANMECISIGNHNLLDHGTACWKKIRLTDICQSDVCGILIQNDYIVNQELIQSHIIFCFGGKLVMLAETR